MPLSTASLVRRCFSSSEPSHQTIWSGLVSLAISSTQARSLGLFVGESLVFVAAARLSGMGSTFPRGDFEARGCGDARRGADSSTPRYGFQSPGGRPFRDCGRPLYGRAMGLAGARRGRRRGRVGARRTARGGRARVTLLGRAPHLARDRRRRPRDRGPLGRSIGSGTSSSRRAIAAICAAVRRRPPDRQVVRYGGDAGGDRGVWSPPTAA